MHTLYLGPSWAVQSYESLHGDDDPVKTNLAAELKLTNFTSIARPNNTNLNQLTAAIKFMDENPELAPFRILFVLSTSFDDAPGYYALSREQFANKFLVSTDPIGLIKDLEKIFYNKLNELDIPIGLIGAHTDVLDFNLKENITIIHPSWQNFLGSLAGLEPFLGGPQKLQIYGYKED